MTTLTKKNANKDTDITQEDFESFFLRTTEDKYISPSGLHLGHFKAAARNKEISYVLWSILHISYKNGFCLKRWRRSATTLIEKIPGFPKIHKFHTIHLIETDLNFVMRFIWGNKFMSHSASNKIHFMIISREDEKVDNHNQRFSIKFLV